MQIKDRRIGSKPKPVINVFISKQPLTDFTFAVAMVAAGFNPVLPV